MTYYCTVHRDEDQQALQGEKLDGCTSHMVCDTGYDLAQLRAGLQPFKVIWEMTPDSTAKFGYRFGRLVGIPA